MLSLLITQYVTSATERLCQNKTKDMLCVDGRVLLISCSVQIQTFWRNKHLESHQTLEESSEITFNPQKWIYFHSCLSSWLQQWSGPIFSIFFDYQYLWFFSRFANKMNYFKKCVTLTLMQPPLTQCLQHYLTGSKRQLVCILLATWCKVECSFHFNKQTKELEVICWAPVVPPAVLLCPSRIIVIHALRNTENQRHKSAPQLSRCGPN